MDIDEEPVAAMSSSKGAPPSSSSARKRGVAAAGAGAGATRIDNNNGNAGRGHAAAPQEAPPPRPPAPPAPPPSRQQHQQQQQQQQHQQHQLIEPDPLPPPRIDDCQKQTMEVTSQGRLHAVDCLISHTTNTLYALIRTLRPAIYGKVKLGMTLERREDGSYHMLTDRPVAIKIVRKEKLGGRSQEDPLKEISVMQYLSQQERTEGYEFVMGLVEVLQDADNIYIILPFCDGGEICQWFERSRYMLREEVARGFFWQIVKGLDYLHRNQVVHRDMSLENLLYDQKTKQCVIIDLGMCLKLPAPATSHVLVRKQGYCGKLTYMSHEIYKNKDFYAAAVDIWALGVILFIMLTGIPPIETPSEIDPRFRMLAEGRLFELMDLWRVDFLSAEARDLLYGLLQVDPRARLTMEEIRGHAWMAGPISSALGGSGSEGSGEGGEGEGRGATDMAMGDMV